MGPIEAIVAIIVSALVLPFYIVLYPLKLVSFRAFEAVTICIFFVPINVFLTFRIIYVSSTLNALRGCTRCVCARTPPKCGC
jgi:hypothetical protein